MGLLVDGLAQLTQKHPTDDEVTARRYFFTGCIMALLAAEVGPEQLAEDLDKIREMVERDVIA